MLQERPMTLLAIRELSKHYPVGGSKRLLSRSSASFVHAVDGVNLSIGAGESVGLVGESGCGKSTLAQLVCRLADPTGGSIEFAGHEITAVPMARFARTDLRPRIQMVFQDAGESLNPRFTAFEAIADPLYRMLGLRGRQLTERVCEAARKVGLQNELLPRYPHQLSGGQKSRVDIARAIAPGPDLLVLDEPTAAVDVSIQAVILTMLAQLRREMGMSFLFVSHDINVVRMMCDRVAVMYLGKVVEEGPAQEVFREPLHPYTAALVDAVPHLGEQGKAKVRLPGEPRSPIDPQARQCRLYGRCPNQVAICEVQAPALEETEPGRLAACHLLTRIPIIPTPTQEHAAIE
jgi:oligopeptide/dipeptide ABC transporter ATP-binding protein